MEALAFPYRNRKHPTPSELPRISGAGNKVKTAYQNFHKITRCAVDCRLLERLRLAQCLAPPHLNPFYLTLYADNINAKFLPTCYVFTSDRYTMYELRMTTSHLCTRVNERVEIKGIGCVLEAQTWGRSVYLPITGRRPRLLDYCQQQQMETGRRVQNLGQAHVPAWHPRSAAL